MQGGSLLSGKPLRPIIGGLLLLNGFFPALWILSTSLKAESELTQVPITWIPHAPTLANCCRASTDQPLFLFNSLAVATLSTVLTLLVPMPASHAPAGLNLRSRGLILSTIIAVSTFPLVTLLVPLFQIMRGLNLLNT